MAYKKSLLFRDPTVHTHAIKKETENAEIEKTLEFESTANPYETLWLVGQFIPFSEYLD